MHVLLSSYACAPHSGSEPGIGWNWVFHLAARGHEVTVLTTQESRERIERELEQKPLCGVHFHYVTMPRRLREASVVHYLLWQWRALKEARRLAVIHLFDVVHHVSYGSIHVPSLLWRLGIPMVFGPVGGGQVAPNSMLKYFGSAKRGEQVRTMLTKMLPSSPLHRLSLRKMGAVLAANTDTARLIKQLGREDVEQMFDTGIASASLVRTPRQFSQADGPLRVLWVGRMLPRKAIGLSLDIFRKVTVPATLTIIGDGLKPSVVRKMIHDRDLDARVFWCGHRLPLEEVLQAYTEHDIMLFNSLRESGGSQLVEAMALGLPIVTLNLHGPGDTVPADAGFKVDVHSPEQVVTDMAAAIDAYAALSPEARSRMSAACLEFAKGALHEGRAERAEAIYRRLLQRQELTGR